MALNVNATAMPTSKLSGEGVRMRVQLKPPGERFEFNRSHCVELMVSVDIAGKFECSVSPRP
jgi:hypothetical protein